MKAVIIGSGFIADFHAFGYQEAQGVSLAAVCDTDGARAAAFGKKHGCAAYIDAATMLEERKPELVSICLPTFLHEEYTRMALRAGAHVLCEKPLALTLDGCRRMAEEARQANRLLMTGQVLRYWPEYVHIAERLRGGDLGEPRMLQALRLQHPSRVGWHFDPKLGGGSLFDLFIHDLDFVCSLLGTSPTSLSANGVQGAEGSWRRVSAALRWADGTCAQLDAGSLMPQGYPFTASFRVECDGGCMEYRFRAPQNIHRSAKSNSDFMLYQNGAAQELPIAADAQGEAFKAEIAAFARGVREGVSPLPVEETIAVMELVHRVRDELEAHVARPGGA